MRQWMIEQCNVSGDAYGPLLKVPGALVIHVRGQSHDTGAGIGNPGFKYQADYIEFWLKFFGVEDVRSLVVEHTWDANVQETLERGKARAIVMALDF
ncbi:hypothetical protein [Burkholderia ubonensis]|uniref:Flavodoxin-like fold domain-containing protein n=1 Tax=Burkholderia ubonensis subsp. mesacidophila TaxID=265293 RepID=A0A2A4FJ93_9BURK|nr:hypothetical protein [Burkholderia ubonensis]PCE32740.1 hypothetical protein BZL54_08800 [Burkholderia ubonensis subsp. mesacidophila]